MERNSCMVDSEEGAKKIILEISDERYAILQKLADREQISLNDIIFLACMEYSERERLKQIAKEKRHEYYMKNRERCLQNAKKQYESNRDDRLEYYRGYYAGRKQGKREKEYERR